MLHYIWKYILLLVNSVSRRASELPVKHVTTLAAAQPESATFSRDTVYLDIITCCKPDYIRRKGQHHRNPTDKYASTYTLICTDTNIKGLHNSAVVQTQWKNGPTQPAETTNATDTHRQQYEEYSYDQCQWQQTIYNNLWWPVAYPGILFGGGFNKFSWG
jgi:hypothetical protein